MNNGSGVIRFGDLYLQPSRNGLTKPKHVRGEGTRMVNMGEVFAHGRLNNVEMDFVPMTAQERDNFLLEPCDLLFARQSLVPSGAGKCSIFLSGAGETTFESHLIRVRLNQKKADPHFYYYYFLSLQGRADIESIVEQGAGVAGIRGTDLQNLYVGHYQLAEQKSIASLLSSMDDKIDLNANMNRTLDSMARALFKDWFVDFGPTRAKMEKRVPYLSSEVWGLFPDSLDEGGRPKGWIPGSLSDVTSLNPESWSRATYPNMIDYVDLSSTKWGTIEGTARHDKFSSPSRAQRILRSGDTIVGTVRPGNGSYAFVSMNGLTGSTGFAVLRPSRTIYQEATYLAATSKENIDRLAHVADGGAYPAVRPEVVAATSLVLAPEKVFAAFSDTVRELFGQTEANKAETRQLAAARDFLLRRLFAGEIHLSEPEQSTEAAL